jgi:hypothetical protein
MLAILWSPHVCSRKDDGRRWVELALFATFIRKVKTFPETTQETSSDLLAKPGSFWLECSCSFCKEIWEMNTQLSSPTAGGSWDVVSGGCIDW